MHTLQSPTARVFQHPGPSARRWGWACVALLHAALLWLGWRWSVAPPPGAPAPTVVWWLSPPDNTGPRPEPAAVTALPHTTPRPTTVPKRGTTQPNEPPALQALTGPDAGRGIGADTGFVEAATAPASAASAPLRLDLPRLAPRAAREASLGAALNDPRSNSPPVTLASRLAAVMGDGRVTVEDLGDGRKRYRRGAECLESRPARANLIDPFNARAFNAPDLVGRC